MADMTRGWAPKPLWRVIQEEEDHLARFQHRLDNDKEMSDVERSTLQYHVDTIERTLRERHEARLILDNSHGRASHSEKHKADVIIENGKVVKDKHGLNQSREPTEEEIANAKTDLKPPPPTTATVTFTKDEIMSLLGYGGSSSDPDGGWPEHNRSALEKIRAECHKNWPPKEILAKAKT